MICPTCEKETLSTLGDVTWKDIFNDLKPVLIPTPGELSKWMIFSGFRVVRNIYFDIAKDPIHKTENYYWCSNCKNYHLYCNNCKRCFTIGTRYPMIGKTYICEHCGNKMYYITHANEDLADYL